MARAGRDAALRETKAAGKWIISRSPPNEPAKEGL